MPKSKKYYWENKLRGNITRFRNTTRALKKAGWKVGVVWECQAKKPDQLEKRIEKVLILR